MEKLLICFDVDGTLIDDTVFIWQTLHDKMNTDPIEREYWANAYWTGKITYEQWAQKDVEMWIKMRVNRSHLLLAIEALKPMQGALETINILHKQSHYLGIISGSLDIALDQAIPDYKTLFDYVFLNHLVFDDADMLKGVIPTPFDIEHKASGLRKMAHELNMPMNRTVFIGDNFNDIEVAKSAGCSIAFNCKSEELASVADHVVPGPDIRAVIPIIEQYWAGVTLKAR
ncbi:HAD family phosphatase [bacterium]|nr:HAD family phosphatase [candidate division CSSED10-310 bacterium]